MSDPEATQSEDWDEEWEVPQVPNPEYQRVWMAHMIDNREYQGEWVHPMIDSAELEHYDTVYSFSTTGVVGIETSRFSCTLYTSLCREGHAL